ncbi:MAG: hypothetical protein QHJ73_03790 [Armatimonadota bacterium]|nr:hypothetical protein [Armatimonadota bacterium]
MGGRSRLKRMLAAAASGVLLAAAFPKLDRWWLVWVALVPLLVVTRGRRPRAAAGLGLLTGVLFFGILLQWVCLFDCTGWVLLTLWQASYVAAFAVLWVMLAPAGPVGWRGILAPAAAWTALEWVRSLSRGGFTWGGLAYALHGQLPLVQLASLLGPLGMSFFVVATNAAVAGVVAARADLPERTRALRRLEVVAVLLLAAWGWGCWRMTRPIAVGPATRVALLQASLVGEGRDEPWPPEKIEELRKLIPAAGINLITKVKGEKA